jgi:hypothetical protein
LDSGRGRCTAARWRAFARGCAPVSRVFACVCVRACASVNVLCVDLLPKLWQDGALLSATLSSPSSPSPPSPHCVICQEAAHVPCGRACGGAAAADITARLQLSVRACVCRESVRGEKQRGGATGEEGARDRHRLASCIYIPSILHPPPFFECNPQTLKFELTH